jgi:hypothetical protein
LLEILLFFYSTSFQVKIRDLARSANSVKISKLESNTRYQICILGKGDWLANTYHQTETISVGNSPLTGYTSSSLSSSSSSNLVNSSYNSVSNHNINSHEQYDALIAHMKDSAISRCTSVRTLENPPNYLNEIDSLAGGSLIQAFLKRRLGLIVGCCLGIIVFIVLVSVLSYLKIKRQRIYDIKRQQAMPPTEILSYRHYSIPSSALEDPNRVDFSITSNNNYGNNMDQLQQQFHNNHHGHHHHHINHSLLTSNLLFDTTSEGAETLTTTATSTMSTAKIVKSS